MQHLILHYKQGTNAQTHLFQFGVAYDEMAECVVSVNFSNLQSYHYVPINLTVL